MTKASESRLRVHNIDVGRARSYLVSFDRVSSHNASISSMLPLQSLKTMKRKVQSWLDGEWPNPRELEDDLRLFAVTIRRILTWWPDQPRSQKKRLSAIQQSLTATLAVDSKHATRELVSAMYESIKLLYMQMEMLEDKAWEARVAKETTESVQRKNKAQRELIRDAESLLQDIDERQRSARQAWLSLLQLVEDVRGGLVRGTFSRDELIKVGVAVSQVGEQVPGIDSKSDFREKIEENLRTMSSRARLLQRSSIDREAYIKEEQRALLEELVHLLNEAEAGPVLPRGR